MSTPTEYENEVIIKDGAVVFPNHGNYEIGLERVSTPELLLAWLVHMCGKTWFKQEIAFWFILKVSRHHKMKIPQSV